ncbi:hypothetical protein MUK42_25526 [Musa troglodytarum]|uniref:lipoyl(octanoyl) transferase n=1 Tax=Musa troglodytarum TaxID=320322 RepID=A0A9E7HDG3_9LILI|nr:hypothetical protein MUK42_25526 [Musa troglodytarum]
MGAELHYTERGGDITFHGPRQAILYPIVSLRDIGFGARNYVEGLESVMIEVASFYGVNAHAGKTGETGVWVGDRKIGAIGVRISSGITSHGLAFNIDPDLSYFKHIVPCGIPDKGVTSLKTETQKELPPDEVIHEQLIHCFAKFPSAKTHDEASVGEVIGGGSFPAPPPLGHSMRESSRFLVPPSLRSSISNGALRLRLVAVGSPKPSPRKGDDNGTTDIYNVEAAEILVNEAQALPVTEAAPIYEQLLCTFPTAAKYWKQYVEAYMAINNDEVTKQIFSRCLLNCLQISLWRCYISFIKKVNEKKGPEGLEETKKAFDFMLNYVGYDIASGPVWLEYIAFLKSLPAKTAQEESHHMTSVRKVYQRAIVTPTHHVEQLWKDYENFENSVSRTLAKGLLSEYQPKFNSAKAVYRERKKYVDEIDWNMLAVPPTGSYKEEQQCMAWKRLLIFEKGNPQRIDTASANRRITFTYEQSLMYLYHYPDLWYDYATWHANSGSVDSAIKIFQRALKAVPDSELLKYAYAELEESRGAIQPAKKIYESLLSSSSNTTSLAHIQFFRFLRRTEGVEAARKYFLDCRKSPSCTYHVFVAYAMMVFCVDKDPKAAHNIFEAGLKKFMNEPGYILEYADFLCRLNDDRNVRALFERALSSLPPEKSVEIWIRFCQFEQTYGDLTSVLKAWLHLLQFLIKQYLYSNVEQRKKEALSRSVEEGSMVLENTLYDVIPRYSFMDLWPCSSKDLDHLARQEWLVKNINRRVDKSNLLHGANITEKGSVGLTTNSKVLPPSAKVVYPDTARMVIYDPRQTLGSEAASTSASGLSLVGSGLKASDDILKVISPTLVAFITNMPAVEGPSPDIDVVLSILLQSSIPTGQTGKPATSLQQMPGGPGPTTSDHSGSIKTRMNNGPPHRPPRDGHSGKRKDLDIAPSTLVSAILLQSVPEEWPRASSVSTPFVIGTEKNTQLLSEQFLGQEDDESMTVQSRPLPRDVFRLRQMHKSRGRSTSQTGSAASGGSAFSGDQSVSTD